MVWWLVLLITVGFQVLSGLLARPARPKPEDRPRFPTNEGATPIPVAFGEVLITGPHIMDWFDYQPIAIKKRNPATFFITSLTIGYEYYVGMVFGLCWDDDLGVGGAVLTGIYIDTKRAWDTPDIGFPSEQGASNIFHQLDPTYINRPTLFGAEKQEGGCRANLCFYSGRDLSAPPINQPLIADPYWAAQRGVALPHYKDIARLIWYGPSQGVAVPYSGGKRSGYIGNSATLWPLAIKLSRWPLHVSAFGEIAHVSAGDGTLPGGLTYRHANGVECIYELLINPHYGKGIDPDEIEFDDFQGSAITIAAEEWGFSYLWTQASPVEEMISEVLRYINGVLWTDMLSGKIRLKLIRADYDASLLPILDNSDLIEIESYRVGSWEDTYNLVTVTFPDHSTTDFKTESVEWINQANRDLQGVARPTEIHFEGCPTRHLAMRLAEREGRALSLPPIELTAKVDRKQHDWHPGKVFKWSWPEQGINEIVMRVTTMKLGTILDGAITISAVRDVFATGIGIASQPGGTIWTNPLDGAAQDAVAVAGEVPHWMQRDDTPRLFGLAARPTPLHYEYDGALNGSAEVLNNDFTASGTLLNAYPQLSTTDFDTSSALICTGLTDAEAVEAGTSSLIASEGAGLALIGDPATGAHEWIAFETLGVSGADRILNNVWRGLLDTPPRAHAAGTRVWFFKTGVAFFEVGLTAGQAVVFEALTRVPRNSLTAAAATDHNVTMQQRAFRPLPPYYVRLGGSYTNLVQETGDLIFTWREQSRLNFPLIIKQSAATATPEDEVEYEIEIYDASTPPDAPTLLRTVTGLTSPTYTYANADELSDLADTALAARLLFQFYADRDGLRSLYPWERYVYRVDPALFESVVTVNGLTVTVDGAVVTQT